MKNRYVSELFKSGAEFEEFLTKLDAFKRGVENGDIVIPKASKDGNGDNIADTYAKKSALTGGSLKVAKATAADSATKATQDGNGNVIANTYAKSADLTGGSLKVAKATAADSATKATQDGNGANIADTYATKSALTGGSLKVAKATAADSATKATQDGNGANIASTYAKSADLTSGTLVPKSAIKATTANGLSVELIAKVNSYSDGVMSISLEAKTLYLLISKNRCFLLYYGGESDVTYYSTLGYQSCYFTYNNNELKSYLSAGLESFSSAEVYKIGGFGATDA